tara:strand:- start:372 stop:602 length:231 start_codon:yes stop_codon:yes gene_type:complete
MNRKEVIEEVQTIGKLVCEARNKLEELTDNISGAEEDSYLSELIIRGDYDNLVSRLYEIGNLETCLDTDLKNAIWQ